MGIILLISCSTSNQVVSNKLFQKRKYQRGWHVNSTKNYDKSSSNNDLELEVFNSDQVDDQNSSPTSGQSTEVLESTVITSESVEIDGGKLTQDLLQNPKGTLANEVDEVIVPSISDEELSLEKTGNYKTRAEADSDFDESDRRILLAILAILVLIFTGISPLAVWIAIGRGQSLRVNSILFFSALILAIVLIFAIILALSSASFEILTVVVGLLTIGLFLASFIHAIFVIIRGY